eukprot:611600-Pleurochrysis_carterae.AAC.4
MLRIFDFQGKLRLAVWLYLPWGAGRFGHRPSGAMKASKTELIYVQFRALRILNPAPGFFFGFGAVESTVVDSC